MEPPPPPAPAPNPEGPAGRFALRLGLALLVLASFLPYHGCIAEPDDFEPVPLTRGETETPDAAYVPLARAQWVVRHDLLGEEGLEEEDLFLGTNAASNDYGFLVFAALPLWLGFWGLTRRRGSSLRRGLGIGLWTLSGFLPPAFYLALRDERPGSPGFPPWMALAVAAAAASALVLRPRGRRRPEDVEATLSTHAVIGLGVALCRPVLDYYRWFFVDGHSAQAVAKTFFVNYRPGFWITLTALTLLATPLYFSEESLRGLYDRCRPWRSRSSTPTPTSTSTGSMPTGTPSSTAPAPPGSSPS